MAEFRAGDLVQLKSGGPKMTVDFYREELDVYICSWFDHKHERKQDSFAPDTLEKMETGGSNRIKRA
jgi:uncharacterized protein YodC (DUF2158 family)